MKKLLPLLTPLLFLVACKTSKSYVTRPDADKSVFDAVKALSKKPGDTIALNALPVVYANAIDRHLNKIKSIEQSQELTRWDNLVREYDILQSMYVAITNEPTSNSIVKAKNYESIIYDLKQQGAADYFAEANVLMNNQASKADAKEAYFLFKKASQFVPDFNGAKARMADAYEAAIVNVIINPVADNSFFFNTGSWGNYGYNYSNEYFQQTLVRELGGENATRYPARFYTDWSARRDNVQPDWVIDLTLKNMDLPRPSVYNYRRNASKQIEIGRDTANKAVYKTVHATVNISRYSFQARADMEVRITDLATRKSITGNTYSEYYNWQEETATYSGDSRALSSSEWDMVNRSNYNEPRKEEVLNELYRKLYSQVRNKIVNAVDW